MTNYIDFYNNYKGKKIRYESYIKKINEGVPPEQAIVNANTLREKELSPATKFYNAYEGEKCPKGCFLNRVYKGLPYEQAIVPNKIVPARDEERIKRVRENFRKIDKYYEVKAKHHFYDSITNKFQP